MSLSFCAICNARDREIQEIAEASSTCFGRRRRAQGGMRSRECSGPRMWLNLEVAGGWGGESSTLGVIVPTENRSRYSDLIQS